MQFLRVGMWVGWMCIEPQMGCAELSSAGQLELFGMYAELSVDCLTLGQYGLTSTGHIVGVGWEVRRAIDGRLLETLGRAVWIVDRTHC